MRRYALRPEARWSGPIVLAAGAVLGAFTAPTCGFPLMCPVGADESSSPWNSEVWNSGVVEGHVNRIKMLKRRMFGRADFALLRKGVLLAS